LDINGREFFLKNFSLTKNLNIDKECV